MPSPRVVALKGIADRPVIRHHASNEVVFTDERLDRYVRSYAKPQVFHHAFEYYRALPQSIAQNEKLASTKLTLPVLAVGGGGNGGFGATQPENIRRFATNVESHVLPGCGHWVPRGRVWEGTVSSTLTMPSNRPSAGPGRRIIS